MNDHLAKLSSNLVRSPNQPGGSADEVLQSIYAPWDEPLASRAAVKAQRGSGLARCRDCRDCRGFFLTLGCSQMVPPCTVRDYEAAWMVCA